jgi:hypothetical protein
MFTSSSRAQKMASRSHWVEKLIINDGVGYDLEKVIKCAGICVVS